MTTVSEYEQLYPSVISLMYTLRLQWHRNRLCKEHRMDPQLESLLTSEDHDELDCIYQIIYRYYPEEYCESYAGDEDDIEDGMEDGMEDVIHDFFSNSRLQNYYHLCSVYSELCGSTLIETPYYRKLYQFIDRHLGRGSWGVRLSDNVSYPSIEILYYSEQEMEYSKVMVGLLDLDYFLEKEEKPLLRAVKKKKRSERRKKVRTNV